MNILYNHRTQGKAVERVHILGVVNALRKMGNNVDVMSVPGVDIFQKQEKQVPTNTAVNFSVLSFLSSRVHGSIFELFELLYNFVLLFRLLSYFRNKNVDFVYERYSLYMFVTVLLCKILRKKIILEINDSVAVSRVRTCHFKFMARLIERWVLKNATGLVIISNNFKNTLVEAYGDIADYVISPNAVDSDLFIPDINKVKLIREKYKLDNEAVICGFTGAFLRWHGIDWFVNKAIKRITENNNLILLLVGDGELFTQIKSDVVSAGLEKRIILTGRVSHDEIANYLGVMDFAIMPDSNEYGSPMKLFEYMSCGLGTVIPAYDPVKECVENNVNGWLTDIGDQDSFINKVMAVSFDRKVFNEIGENASSYIKSNRQWTDNAEQLLSLLGE